MLASSNVQATLDMIVKSLAEEDDATLTPMKTPEKGHVQRTPTRGSPTLKEVVEGSHSR